MSSGDVEYDFFQKRKEKTYNACKHTNINHTDLM